MQPYQTNIETLCKELKTNLSTGLSKGEARLRFETYGPNTIKEEKKLSPLMLVIRQFLSPLMYILLIASVASLLIGEVKDAIVIFIAMIINVIIGFTQEWKAEKAAEALKAYEALHCQVRRDDKIVLIEAKKLVPGDIVIISSGSKIPADIRLSYAAGLTVEEALLTGESRPVSKNTEALKEQLSLGDRSNMVFSGTYALGGKGEGVVVATGTSTELGKIATLIGETEEEYTPLQLQIKRFGWFLGWLMLGIVGIVFVLGLLKQMGLKELATTSIALAVAAIPEGLLVAVTVVLAIGMQKMLKRKALVRHLIAAETLGSVSVICTDKTGTLTEGRMAVKVVATSDLDFLPNDNKNVPEKIIELFRAATLNNDAQINLDSQQRMGNPTEVALLEAAHNMGIDTTKLKKEIPRTDEVPFSSNIKYMATAHQVDGKQKIIVKGALEKIVSMSLLSKEEKDFFNNKSKTMMKEGLRILALAQKEVGKEAVLENELSGLTFLGLVGLQDPLRKQAAQTVADLTNAGIKTVVVTGDHKDTAVNITKGAGLSVDEKNILTGRELDEMEEEDLYDRIPSIDLFARVDPKHKIRIVDAWQKRGESVAMIGDGVNDAPALKAADIGVALGSGSDVTHETSDMVLLNNNLATISAAVRQGRIIFDNIRKIIVYLMADSFSEIILILGALLIGLPLPILATQIFWINLVTDGFPDLALTMEPGEPEVMSERPRSKDEPIMDRDMKLLIFLIGIVTDIGLFGLYITLLNMGWDLIHVRTIMFTALGIDSLLYVFSVRSIRTSIFRVNPFKNKWLNIAVVAGAFVQLSAIYIPSMRKLFSTVPLGMKEWGIILALALIKIFCIEITKELFFRHPHTAKN